MVEEEVRKMSEQQAEEVSRKEKIIELLARGYSRAQLINDLDFKENTVDKAIKEFKERYGREPARQAQPGANHGGERARELMKIGAKDMIPPEAVLEVLHLPGDGQDVMVWRQGVLDGVGLLLLGARFSQLCAAGQAETIARQLEVWREAKQGTREIAEEAAMQAALGVSQQLSPQIQAIRSQMASQQSDNPMAGLMATLFQPVAQQVAQNLARAFGGMMLGGQPAAPQAVQPGQEGSDKPAGDSGGQPSPGWTPPNLELHSIDEWEEK
jgi:hypothetical protein